MDLFVQKNQSDAETIREVIRLLNLALADCHRILAVQDAEADVLKSQHPERPPH